MPFNERGEWELLSPLEEYKSRVIKSKANPGSGGLLWTTEFRNKMHDEAALFVMEQEGTPFTPENLRLARERITRDVEEEFDIDERNGFIKHTLPPERVILPGIPNEKIGD